MKYKFEKAFAHDFKKIKDNNLAKAILFCIKKIAEAESSDDIPNLKKLKGFKSAYRIRTGDYRIGILIQNNMVIFVAFAHRKDVYKKFP